MKIFVIFHLERERDLYFEILPLRERESESEMRERESKT